MRSVVTDFVTLARIIAQMDPKAANIRGIKWAVNFKGMNATKPDVAAQPA